MPLKFKETLLSEFARSKLIEGNHRYPNRRGREDQLILDGESDGKVVFNIIPDKAEPPNLTSVCATGLRNSFKNAVFA